MRTSARPLARMYSRSLDSPSFMMNSSGRYTCDPIVKGKLETIRKTRM